MKFKSSLIADLMGRDPNLYDFRRKIKWHKVAFELNH